MDKVTNSGEHCMENSSDSFLQAPRHFKKNSIAHKGKKQKTMAKYKTISSMEVLQKLHKPWTESQHLALKSFQCLVLHLMLEHSS